MQANIFYHEAEDCACPITIIPKDKCVVKLSKLSKVRRACLEAQAFTGGLSEVGLLYSPSGSLQHVYIGAGDLDISLGLISAVLRLPAGNYSLTQTVAQDALIKWSLAQYKFTRYKAANTAPRRLLLSLAQREMVIAWADAIFLVRDLINTPTNALGPKELADVMLQLSHTHGGELQQWVGDELLKSNFPAIYAVGCAAASAPRLLSMMWGSKKHPLVTLVGKGVCFDSGGLNLKSANYMRLMKKDMGGAAQVLGLAQWIMTVKLPIRLQVLIPAVENSVSGTSYRPGDVLTMRNGLTVEIDNTDAEGRLVLADALVKACEEKPELLIDFATLTGAARVAVGTEIAALFSNDDKLASDLMAIAQEVNDPMWRLPIFAGYSSLLDSSIADLVNSSPSSYAGAITAALFLQRFVSKQQSWAHFDVMAWNLSNKPGKPEGGEAMGICAVGEYLLRRFRI